METVVSDSDLSEIEIDSDSDLSGSDDDDCVVLFEQVNVDVAADAPSASRTKNETAAFCDKMLEKLRATPEGAPTGKRIDPPAWAKVALCSSEACLADRQKMSAVFGCATVRNIQVTQYKRQLPKLEALARTEGFQASRVCDRARKTSRLPPAKYKAVWDRVYQCIKDDVSAGKSMSKAKIRVYTREACQHCQIPYDDAKRYIGRFRRNTP
uniref:Uncharacterized protein n=1 Tax=Neobodo designis TaxID=312471 RepID=A0A7S1L1K1_NEODS